MQCRGKCGKEVYFDKELHQKLLAEKRLLTKEELNRPEIQARYKNVGTTLPFDDGTTLVHSCKNYNPKKGEWAGREDTTKNTYHGYDYNAFNVEGKIPVYITGDKSVPLSPKKLSDYADNDNNKPTTKQDKEEVIVFSEADMIETQKQIVKAVESLSKRIETIDKILTQIITRLGI